MSAMKDAKRAGHKNEAEGFPFWQSRLPNQLGVSEELVRAGRDSLQEGVDWKRQGQRVLFSAIGVERLGKLLRIGEGGASSIEHRALGIEHWGGGGIAGLLPERAGSLEELSAPFLVRTMRCHFENRHLVEVVIDGGATTAPAPHPGPLPEERGRKGGARGYMKVRSSENFLPGMLCWARLVKGQAVWVFCGRGDRPATNAPACPRWKGRF